MNRRSFVAGMAAVMARPSSTAAQSRKVYRLAIVELAKETPEHKSQQQAFRAGMRELGYVEGGNLIIEWRYADNDPALLRTLVGQVIALRPDVLLGFETAAQVMRERTQTIPIVLTGAFDPVRAGLARNLRQPGLNVTGSTQLMDVLTAKHFEILREIAPHLARIGQLVDTTSSGCKLIEEYARGAAKEIGIRFIAYPVRDRREVEQAFARMKEDRPDALLPCPSPVLFSLRDVLFENAVRLKIPFTSYVPTNLPLGVLFSYAATIEEGYHRAASYVDKILKGAKAGDLPIEQPPRVRFVVNARTAKTFGLSIPPAVLLRADHVIE